MPQAEARNPLMHFNPALVHYVSVQCRQPQPLRGPATPATWRLPNRF